MVDTATPVRPDDADLYTFAVRAKSGEDRFWVVIDAPRLVEAKCIREFNRDIERRMRS